MEITYGLGTYLEGNRNLSGQIILSEHKLYIKGEDGDYAQTYIPLEKISSLQLSSKGLNVFVRPSVTHQYTALIVGQKKYLKELLKEVVKRRGLKKKFLSTVWIESL